MTRGDVVEVEVEDVVEVSVWGGAVAGPWGVAHAHGPLGSVLQPSGSAITTRFHLVLPA